MNKLSIFSLTIILKSGLHTADLLKYYILIWNVGYIIHDFEVVWAFVFCYGCVNKTWMLPWNVKKSLLRIAHTNVRLLNYDEKLCSKLHCIIWIHLHILSRFLGVLAIYKLYTHKIHLSSKRFVYKEYGERRLYRQHIDLLNIHCHSAPFFGMATINS